MDGFWKLIDALKEQFGDLFGPILIPVFGFLSIPFETIPFEWARWFALGLFFLAGLWVSTLKTEYVYKGAFDRAKWRDLRIWTWLILIPYFYVYWVY